MVCSRQPQRTVSAHAVPADSAIDLGVLEHVADVQRTCYVGRWDDQRKHWLPGFGVRPKDAVIDPPLRPMRLKALRLIDFLELHGEFSI